MIDEAELFESFIARNANCVRDYENECSDFMEGEVDSGAQCETDGHYLCVGCRWNAHRKNDYQESPNPMGSGLRVIFPT